MNLNLLINFLLTPTFLYWFVTGSLLFLFFVVLSYLISKTVFNSGKRSHNKEISPDNVLSEDLAYQNALKIMDSARLKSLEILSSSQIEAHKALEDITDISEDHKKELMQKINGIYARQETILKDLGTELLSSYKLAIDEQKRENIRTISSTTDQIKDEMLSQVKEFQSMIRKETIDSKEELEERLKEGYASVEGEINEYKLSKLKKIDEDILNIVSNVCISVIGEVIDASSYEKMILGNLDDEIRKMGIKYGTSQHAVKVGDDLNNGSKS